MKGKIKAHPSNKRVLKHLRESPVGIGVLLMQNMSRDLQKRARKEAPVGVTTNLKQSIMADPRPKVKAGKIVGSVEATVDYAYSVHEGHIPQPQAGRTPASRHALLRWLGHRGIPERALWGVITELRRKGVSRPTPFMRRAFKNYSRAESFAALRTAVKTYQRQGGRI